MKKAFNSHMTYDEKMMYTEYIDNEAQKYNTSASNNPKRKQFR